MNITKEQADKVIAALSMNRIMARDENGNYTKEITAQVVVEALSIMRGLAEDAEPVAPIPYSGADENPPVFARRWKLARDGYGLQRDDDGNYVHIDDALSVIHAATSPQAAQTEAALCEMVRLSEDAGLYDSDFQAGRAGSKP